MRSAVPVLVILSLTHANQKYSKNLVGYTFWHHYRSNFVETKFFSHHSEPSCGIQSVVNARLPRKEYSVCGIRTAVLKITAHSLCGSGTVELQVTEYSVCGSGTSSHRIFCVWNISGSLCNGPNDTSAQGHRLLGQSRLGGAVIYCSILAAASSLAANDMKFSFCTSALLCQDF